MEDENIGNSEGSIYRGEDGNAYQVIRGKSVRVSNDGLRVEGYKSPSDVVINGQTYRNLNGKVYRVEGKKLIEITDRNQLSELDRQMHGGKGNNNSLIYGGLALAVLFLLFRK